MSNLCGSDPTCQMLLPAIAPFFFIALWLGICSLLLKLGGWPRLAETYRAPDPMPEGEKHTMRHGVFNGVIPVNYNGCITVIITPEGIGLDMMKIFKLGQPALFIPWRDIELTEGKRWFLKTVELKVRDTGCEIGLRGDAVVLPIVAAYNRQRR